MTDPTTVAEALTQAISHHQAGRLPEAEHLYRLILEVQPQNPDANHNLGVLAVQLGQPDGALSHFKTALEADPSNAQHWLCAIDALLQTGQSGPARQMLDEGRRRGLSGPEVDALAVRLDLAEAHVGQGADLHDLGRLEEAAECYRHALALNPDSAEAHGNLGNILFKLGRQGEAEACYRRALEARPDCAEVHSNLGNVFRDLGRMDEAVESYQRALVLKPDFALAHNNLGSTLLSLGKADAALAHFEQAVAAKPGFIDAQRNLLLALLYHPSLDQETIFSAHRRFEALHLQRHAPRIQPHRNVPDPNRRLRIGYLSSDFRNHPVARNLLPVVRDRDRDKFEMYCYAEVGRPDTITATFQSLADGWRSTVGLSDPDVATMIRDDNIDVLVCLAARFDKNRPLVCTWKPAPVQISYHDVATSGLAAMDYLISDRVLTPRNSDERFTERLLCLPHFYIGEMPASPPPIRPRSGPIVFGCLNNPAKITEPVLDLWAQALRAVPGSRLLLKYLNWYDVAPVRERVLVMFDRHGIDRDRLSCPVGVGTLSEHLDLYNEIDIALDPFPFSGSTTTFEALFMGVPVVTLRGKTMVGCWSAGMLTSLGLSHLIAEHPADYSGIAQRLATDAGERSLLRRDLRERVARSPLCNPTRKARQIETFYRATWRRWCASQGG